MSITLLLFVVILYLLYCFFSYTSNTTAKVLFFIDNDAIIEIRVGHVLLFLLGYNMEIWVSIRMLGITGVIWESLIEV